MSGEDHPTGHHDGLDWGECYKCGTSMHPDNVGLGASTQPLCPADRPKGCPECGCVNFSWWVTKQAYVCDNGCGPFGLDEVVE